MAILAERMADNQRVVNAMLDKDKEPLERSGMV